MSKIIMGSYSEEGEDQFFDTCEEISSVSDCGSDCCSSSVGFVNRYEFWTKNPVSVQERRSEFLKSMGLSLDRNLITREDSGDEYCDNIDFDIDRITENSGAVLRTSGLRVSSSQSSMSTWSNDASGSLENGDLEDNCVCTVQNLDDRVEFVAEGLDQNGIISRLCEVASNRSVSFEESLSTLGSSPLVHHLWKREVDEARDSVDLKRKVKKGWLKKLGAVACIVDRHGEAEVKRNDHESTLGVRMRRVRVHLWKKRSKELSSLYAGQEFVAHKGSILTMKFSLDGRYLASAGEDGVVRVWKVIEDERSDQLDIRDFDTSSLYFTMNHLSQLASLDVDKEKIDKTTSFKRPSDSACVVFPPNVFGILEKPLHEFQGHSGEVLDLSWSKKGFLLSSSADKTVRLWQVGCDRCLRVFSHNNYVTCVAFNPVDDNYFISGSIDGKVRIWEVLGCQLVDYTDIREIVSAVCYRPDGKGGIVGSMTGNCRFYDIIDNRLQLDAQICLQGKKKLQGKRITGFQFSPTDPSKLIVTSADSLIRLLSGVDVICKLKASGLRIQGNQMFATFTSDGKHIVSASEDSNVYVWNYSSQDKNSRAKNIRSCESFLSQNASVAIPWSGIEAMPGTLQSPAIGGGIRGNSLENGQKHHNFNGELDQIMPHSSPDCFSLMQGFFLESLTRGSVTWPEEKLPYASPVSVSPAMCKSKLKFLKSACQSMLSSSHMWGLVIVTAGWDGRIRTYLNYGLPIRL